MSNSSASLIRVGYITGYRRSCSTVLGIVLGGHPALLNVGELWNLTVRVWPNNEYCSCGARVRDCPFWSAVVERFTGRLGSQSIADYARLQRRYDSLGVIGQNAIGLRTMGRGFADYCLYTRALLMSLADISGRSLIIDSSKLPGRALCLMSINGLDARFIHLVRDGRGVAWSLAKDLPRDERAGVEQPLPACGVPRTALRWAMVNLGAETVARRAGNGRAIRLRYEDFCSTPERELQRLGALLEVDLQPLVARLQGDEASGPGHLVAGSRLRMAGPVKVRQDNAWRQQMPAPKQRLAQLLIGWLQQRYGYEDRSAPHRKQEEGWSGAIAERADVSAPPE